MSIQTMTGIHTVTVLKPQISSGVSMDLVRVWLAVRTATCRVKPVGSNSVLFFVQNSQEVDHNLWFNYDPLLTEGDMLLWTVEGIQITMRVTRVPVNLHGLGRIWLAGCIAKREDNLVIITPDTPLT